MRLLRGAGNDQVSRTGRTGSSRADRHPTDATRFDLIPIEFNFVADWLQRPLKPDERYCIAAITEDLLE